MWNFKKNNWNAIDVLVIVGVKSVLENWSNMSLENITGTWNTKRFELRLPYVVTNMGFFTFSTLFYTQRTHEVSNSDG